MATEFTSNVMSDLSPCPEELRAITVPDGCTGVLTLRDGSPEVILTTRRGSVMHPVIRRDGTIAWVDTSEGVLEYQPGHDDCYRLNGQPIGASHGQRLMLETSKYTVAYEAGDFKVTTRSPSTPDGLNRATRRKMERQK